MNKFLPSFACALLLAITAHAKDMQFVSTGKILVGGGGFSPKLENGDPVPDSFYATVCEIAMGAEIQKRAGLRVHALHPDFSRHAVKIKAERSPNTSILVVRVTSENGTYAQAMTDAVMDEFFARWKEIKNNWYETQVVATQDQMVALERDIKNIEEEIKEMERAKVEPAVLDKGKAHLKRRNKRHDALVTRIDALDDALNLTPDVFTIIERASEAEKVQKAP